MVLAISGRDLPGDQVRVLAAVAAHLEAVLERERLRAEAGVARQERERTVTRTALLAAVSHDLRTPLAGIKASVSALRTAEITLDARDEAELLAGIEDSADRLQSLIDNLLDMSRLDSGTVVPVLAPVPLHEILPGALTGVPAERVEVDLPDPLPRAHVDAGLLERALANVVENAVRHTGPAHPVLVRAGVVGDHLVVRVIDYSPT